MGIYLQKGTHLYFERLSICGSISTFMNNKTDKIATQIKSKL